MCEDELLGRHHIVTLSVTTGDASRVPHVVEVLGRTMTGLGLDDYGVTLNVGTLEAYAVEEQE